MKGRRGSKPTTFSVRMLRHSVRPSPTDLRTAAVTAASNKKKRLRLSPSSRYELGRYCPCRCLSTTVSVVTKAANLSDQSSSTNPARPIRRECIFYAFELISEPRVDSIHLMNHFVWTRRQQRTKSALTRACGAVKVIFHVFQAMTRNLHLSTMKVLVHTCFF